MIKEMIELPEKMFLKALLSFLTSLMSKKKKKKPHFDVLASSSQNQSCVSPSEIDLRIKG